MTLCLPWPGVLPALGLQATLGGRDSLVVRQGRRQIVQLEHGDAGPAPGDSQAAEGVRVPCCPQSQPGHAGGRGPPHSEAQWSAVYSGGHPRWGAVTPIGSSELLLVWGWLLIVGCWTSRQHAGMSQWWICWDNCTWYHTETAVHGTTLRQLYVVPHWDSCTWYHTETAVRGTTLRQLYVVPHWDSCTWYHTETIVRGTALRQLYVVPHWDSCSWYHTEAEAADPTCFLTQSQYTDTEPTSSHADTTKPGRLATWVP